MKLLAYGSKGYWADQWNRLDFVVVAASVFGQFFNIRSGAELARIFRTMRVFLIFHRVQGLTELFRCRSGVFWRPSRMLVDVPGCCAARCWRCCRPRSTSWC